MIEIENVTKIFRTKAGTVEALKDVSLKIEKGETYGVIGYSGAGKSPLVRCINFLETPDSCLLEKCLVGFLSKIDAIISPPCSYKFYKRKCHHSLRHLQSHCSIE